MQSLRKPLPLVALAVAVMAALLPGRAGAQFPSRGDDLVSSLGLFRIIVLEPYRPLFSGAPASIWNGLRLTSPVLYDPSTRIGRSDPILDGSPDDVAGTLVGVSSPTMVKDGDFSLVPAGFEGPPGTREVHTNIIDFAMTGSGAAVRAGASAPGRPRSIGEVEALGGPDFPAQSFFDVFVEVDIPAIASFPGTTVYNSAPLVVRNDALMGFPPTVIYIHGSTPAVPVRFLTAGPSWAAGDVFGLLDLSGHGVEPCPPGGCPPTPDPARVEAFRQFVLAQPPLLSPEPATVALLGGGLGVLALVSRASRASRRRLARR